MYYIRYIIKIFYIIQKQTHWLHYLTTKLQYIPVNVWISLHYNKWNPNHFIIVKDYFLSSKTLEMWNKNTEMISFQLFRVHQVICMSTTRKIESIVSPFNRNSGTKNTYIHFYSHNSFKCALNNTKNYWSQTQKNSIWW